MKTQPEARKEKKQEAAVHPLENKKINYLSGWPQWKEKWDKETQVEILHSLLHFGFEVDLEGSEEFIDRICLYFDIADRRFDFSLHGTPNDTYHYLKRFDRDIHDTDNFRQVLGQKAFQMLCQNVFKNTEKHDYYVPSWMRLATHPEIFPKILWFFCLDKDGRLLNLRSSDEHNTEIAREFIQRFCVFAWECDEPPFDSSRDLSDETREIFQQAKPAIIEILFGLHELDILLENHRYQRIDKKCLKKIEDLALRFELWLPQVRRGDPLTRKAKTIKEACLGHSQAAQVLLSLQTMQEEQSRLDLLSEAEEQRREAEEKINSLKR